MDPPDPDPWNWSVTDVVSQFCSHDHLPTGIDASAIAGAGSLTQIFTDNEIDGQTLLNHVDMTVLKDDLGIKALGRRAAIHRAIEQLRRRSVSYQQVHHLQPRGDVATPATTPAFSTPMLAPFPSIESIHPPPGITVALPSPSEPEPHLRPGEIAHGEGPRKRRRLVLPNPFTASQANNDQNGSNIYLTRSGIDIDDHFYSKDTHQEDDSESDDNFAINDTPLAPVGQRKFVGARLRHLMQAQAPIKDHRAVVFPYPERLVKEGNARYATVFTDDGTQAFATRRNALFLNSDLTAFDNAGQHDTSWDYLALKYQNTSVEEETLPLYNDSGSENEYGGSLLDELDAEDTARKEALAQPSRYLTQAEVTKAIDDAISTYTELWKENKQPRKETRAYSLWKKGRGRHGKLTAQSIQQELQKLQHRLGRLKRDVLEQEWQAVKQVQKQCASLELTVYDIAERTWELSVINGPRPPRVRSSRSHRPAKAPRIDDSESGDLIESSDSDDASVGLSDDGPIGMDDVIPEDNVLPDAETKVETSLTRRSSSDSVLGHLLRHRRSSTPIFEPTSFEHPLDLTAASSPAKSAASADLSTIDYEITPQDAQHDEIARWSWSTLLETMDRKRIILKILDEMDTNMRKRVETLFYDFKEDRLKDDVQKALSALENGRNSIVGVDPASPRTETLFVLSRLWLCWHTGTSSPMRDEVEMDTLASGSDLDDFKTYWAFMRSITQVANDSDSAPDSEVDSDPTTPRKKRKHKVMIDKQSQALRHQAHERQKRGQARELLFKETQSSGLADTSHQVVVNTSKANDDDDNIYLNPHIAHRIKEHQLKGLRFMWRELVMATNEGCLLAHTMGLGKTMQTIALLSTIAEAAASPNPGIAQQIPAGLTRQRHLVLCPAVLIGNWADEFNSWLPRHKKLFKVYSITAKMTLADRLATIKRWHESDAVLIISYDMFRTLLKTKKSRASLTPSAESGDEDIDLVSDDKKTIRRYLLAGPTIVVADEAHKLKNRKSTIGRLVHEFKTKSRIALTGSPLANSLVDYYAMIDWIAPGYLGDEREFRVKYKEPIEAGIYHDSSRGQQRKSLTKLKALKADIEPKIDRADITVLKGELTAKTEYVIMLPLTEAQKSVYSHCIRLIQSQDADTPFVTARLWTWIDTLGNLCNHPSLMYKTLKRHISDNAKAAADEVKGKKTGALTKSTKSLDQVLLDDLEQLNLRGQMDMALSTKIPVIVKILQECKRLNEQVLVFSQQIPMLNYLQSLVPTLDGGIRCIRLDGSTDMSIRLDMVKDFNKGSADVFLISTKAGGLGLNISGANRVILCDFGFNPSHEEQAVGRAYRIGQKKPVFVYHLVTGGTYEEKLHHVTIFKHQLSVRVVDDKQPQRAAFKPKDYIFEPKDVEKHDLEEFKYKDDVMDALLFSPLEDLIRNLQTTETMHAEAEEELTPEEEKEVQNDIENEKLRRTDPAAWGAKQRQAAIIAPPMMPGRSAAPSGSMAADTRPPTHLNGPVFEAAIPSQAQSSSTQPPRPAFGQASLPATRPPHIQAYKSPAWLSKGQAWSKPVESKLTDAEPDLPKLHADFEVNKRNRKSRSDDGDDLRRAKQVNAPTQRPTHGPISDPYVSARRETDFHNQQSQVRHPGVKKERKRSLNQQVGDEPAQGRSTTEPITID